MLALRFNLDEAPEQTFAAGIADRPDRAVERARALLELPAPVEESPTADDPVAAIRDVMGWNALYDRTNHRPYITCSRNWDLNKFGGFGFWLNDTLINAFLVALFDLDQARENLSLVFAGATPEGNLPCILTGNDQWVDRTQSPIASLILWMLWLRSGERSLLRAAWPLLSRNNDWLFATRDGNRNGILEFGSSPLGWGSIAAPSLPQRMSPSWTIRRFMTRPALSMRPERSTARMSGSTASPALTARCWGELPMCSVSTMHAEIS